MEADGPWQDPSAGAPGSVPTKEAATSLQGNLGLALSGGGVRAALYSLGVLIALVEVGLNQRVRSIASVSGGSVLNAAIAHSADYSKYVTMEPAPKREDEAEKKQEAFEPTAREIGTILASRGTLAFSWHNMKVLSSLVLRGIAALWFLLLIAIVNLAGELSDPDSQWSKAVDVIPWAWVVPIALAVIALTLVLLRGTFQAVQWTSLIKSVSNTRFARAPRLREFTQGSQVSHVLVATELLSGQPAYFSRDFVYCEPYGWSRPGEVRTSTALYASAAFPVAFPPKKIRRKRLNFQNAGSPPPYPRALKFVDGGVYNNLGHDWFDELKHQKEDPPPLWPFGEIDAKVAEVDQVIVVNASAPSKQIGRTWPGFGTVARIMSVLYDNTVVPRVKLLRSEDSDGAVSVLDISQSPWDLADALGSTDDHPEMFRLLMSRDRAFWDEFTTQAARTRTKLSRAGIETGARLMLHGYLSCLVLLHVAYCVPLPEELRGEEYFLYMAGRGRAKEEQAPDESEADAGEEDATAEDQRTDEYEEDGDGTDKAAEDRPSAG